MPETRCLYFEDARCLEFEAEVRERLIFEDKPAVVLDRTCFYPESGGQPWDLGMIGGAAVLKVVEEGGRILHVLEREIEGGPVRGRVDGARRFDHMQQHSGQHVLSQAFVEILGGETRSFHLGESASTLEIGLAAATEEEVSRVERRANEVVFEDRPVKTYVVPRERIGEVPLRRPPKVEGPVRVVEVEGFDYSACGGTHVGRTGEIGLIKIIGTERIRGQMRFPFVCGGRALADYQAKTAVVRELVGRTNTAERDIPAAMERISAELRSAKKRIQALEETAAGYEARDLAAAARGRVILRDYPDRTPAAVRALALHLIRAGDFFVLLGARSEERSHIVLARSESLAADLRRLVPVLSPMIEGKGGGGPSLVEIAGARGADVEAALRRAAEELEKG